MARDSESNTCALSRAYLTPSPEPEPAAGRRPEAGPGGHTHEHEGLGGETYMSQCLSIELRQTKHTNWDDVVRRTAGGCYLSCRGDASRPIPAIRAVVCTALR
eukprot:scaffold81249_cov67-Phaeocystis_antarctica.AAC.1